MQSCICQRRSACAIMSYPCHSAEPAGNVLQATPTVRQLPADDSYAPWCMDTQAKCSPRVTSQTADPDDPDVSILPHVAMLPKTLRDKAALEAASSAQASSMHACPSSIPLCHTWVAGCCIVKIGVCCWHDGRECALSANLQLWEGRLLGREGGGGFVCFCKLQLHHSSYTPLASQMGSPASVLLPPLTTGCRTKPSSAVGCITDCVACHVDSMPASMHEG